MGHNLRIGKSKAYKKRALICKVCGKQFSAFKDSRIEEALDRFDLKRFIPEAVRDNQGEENRR
jgi:hypothetical protein